MHLVLMTPKPARHPRCVGMLLAATMLSAAGCEYVAYDDDLALSGAPPTTLGDFQATTLDHLALRGLMSRYLTRSKDGTYVLVDYDALAASDEARYTLDQYLAMLAVTDPSKLASSDERLAYWINGYNASVVRGVITKYKGDHSWMSTASGTFFDDPIYTLGGQMMTLNHLEQGVLRGDWAYAGMPRSGALLEKLKAFHNEVWGDKTPDARVHAVLNCAAVSCPNLLASAPYVYSAATIEEQLTAAVTDWLASPIKGAGSNGISSLFDWYRSDFEASHGSIDKFIAAYRTDGLAGVDTSTFLHYDWSLNVKGAK